MRTPQTFRPYMILMVMIIGAAACAGGRQQTTPGAPVLAAGVESLQEGDTWYRKGCYSKALYHYRRAYPDLVAGDHLPEMAICLNNMGNVYLRSGKPENALSFFSEALDIHRSIAGPSGLRRALVNRATAFIRLGQYDKAEADLAEARGTGSPTGPEASPLLTADALLQMHQGDTDAARSLLAQALASVGNADAATTAAIHAALGRLDITGGNADSAYIHFEKALAADRRQEYYRGMAEDLKALGDIRSAQGRHAEAAGLYRRGISLYALIDAAQEAEALREPLARSAAAAGQTIDATLFFVTDWLTDKSFNGPCE